MSIACSTLGIAYVTALRVPQNKKGAVAKVCNSTCKSVKTVPWQDYMISPIFLKNSMRRLASASASAKMVSASAGAFFKS